MQTALSRYASPCIRRLSSLLLLSLLISKAGLSYGAEEDAARDDPIEIEKFVLGVRAGMNDNRNEEDFTKYEFFVNYTLPWIWRSKSGWIFASKIDLTAAVLHAAGTNGFLGSLGPAITVTKKGLRVMVDLGVSPAYLGEDKYGQEDLSGHFQFFTHVGVTVRIIQNLGIGYEFQHVSNAGIQQPNPGLNMHNIQIIYSFW